VFSISTVASSNQDAEPRARARYRHHVRVLAEERERYHPETRMARAGSTHDHGVERHEPSIGGIIAR